MVHCQMYFLRYRKRAEAPGMEGRGAEFSADKEKNCRTQRESLRPKDLSLHELEHFMSGMNIFRQLSN